MVLSHLTVNLKKDDSSIPYFAFFCKMITLIIGAWVDFF